MLARYKARRASTPAAAEISKLSARIYMHAVAYSFALFPICRPQLFTFSPILVGNLPDEISVIMSANQTKCLTMWMVAFTSHRGSASVPDAEPGAGAGAGPAA